MSGISTYPNQIFSPYITGALCLIEPEHVLPLSHSSRDIRPFIFLKHPAGNHLTARPADFLSFPFLLPLPGKGKLQPGIKGNETGFRASLSYILPDLAQKFPGIHLLLIPGQSFVPSRGYTCSAKDWTDSIRCSKLWLDIRFTYQPEAEENSAQERTGNSTIRITTGTKMRERMADIMTSPPCLPPA